MLVDAAIEYENYAQISRTFPINGRFSLNRALVYNAVLKAQLAIIAAIRPGLLWEALQEIAILPAWSDPWWI